MGDFWRKHVVHNFWLKVMSVVLAVGLWYAVVRDRIAEVAVDVPIEFHNIPENLEISSESVPRAQIRVRGSERVIHRLEPADIYAAIDLAGLRPGERTYDLTSREVHKPAELEVVQVLPSQFHIAFDFRESRQVPIQPRVVGTFAQGYQIARIVVDPALLGIVGPKKRVDAVDTAITDPIDVSGAMNQLSFVRHAYVSDSLIQVATPDPVRITVIMEKIPETAHGDRISN
jgi:YbbR domain-containing protein